ncbi:hypothetical protein, partial [Enterococcus faecium]|uniref:hypothetical protein n=1 Tax=Enterococcus faecium TaxID=1352 RepID=UPI003CC622FF
DTIMNQAQKNLNYTQQANYPTNNHQNHAKTTITKKNQTKKPTTKKKKHSGMRLCFLTFSIFFFLGGNQGVKKKT